MEMFVDSEYVQVPLQEAAVVSGGDIAAEEEVTTEEDNVKVSNEDVLNQIQTILESRCQIRNLVCERRVMSDSKTMIRTEFLNIFNPISDALFFPNLHLVIFMKEQDLILRIFIDGRKVFRESLVKAIKSKLSNASDHLGIESVFSAFLSELHTSKYKSCPGAFDEGSFHEKNISTINPKSLLIAKEDSRIIYRSRQCQLFVKDGVNVKCDSCNWLLKSFQTYCRDHPVAGAVSNHLPIPVQDQPSISISNQSQSQPESILADEVAPDSIVTDLSKPSLEELEDQLKSVPHQPLIQPVTEVTVTEDQIKIEEQTIEVETVASENSKEAISKSIYNIRPTRQAGKQSYKDILYRIFIDNPGKKFKLHELYEEVFERVPEYRNKEDCVKNAIRVNLSLQKHMFIHSEPTEEEKRQSIEDGKPMKGGYWTADPNFQEVLKSNLESPSLFKEVRRKPRGEPVAKRIKKEIKKEIKKDVDYSVAYNSPRINENIQQIKVNAGAYEDIQQIKVNVGAYEDIVNQNLSKGLQFTKSTSMNRKHDKRTMTLDEVAEKINERALARIKSEQEQSKQVNLPRILIQEQSMMDHNAKKLNNFAEDPRLDQVPQTNSVPSTNNSNLVQTIRLRAPPILAPRPQPQVSDPRVVVMPTNQYQQVVRGPLVSNNMQQLLPSQWQSSVQIFRQ